MANSVTSKFAGLLRGLFRHREREPASRPVASSPASAPVMAAKQVSVPQNPFSKSPEIPVDDGDEIQLPLAPVVTALPMDLRAKVVSIPAAGAVIRLPVESVMTQLAFGAVKISFGELRQLAPGIFANSSGDHDNRPVSLPLPEILARLNPQLLARRHEHKVEVAEDIAGPFAGRGEGIVFTAQPMKSPAASEEKKTTQPLAFTPHTSRQVAPPPMTAPLPPRAITPASSFNATGRISMPPTKMPSTNGNGNGNSNGHSNGHAKPPLSIKISAAPLPASPPPATKPEPAQPTIFASLADLSEKWPEELQNEIARPPFTNASVPLSGEIVEPGLKRGKVAMTWRQLRLLAMPSSPLSANDNLELELPLKVVAPLFLAAKKNFGQPQAKIRVTADIPDLFFGFPQAAAPVAPAPQPQPKNADTNFYVWGENGEAPKSDEAQLRQTVSPATDFMSRQAHPKEVVATAMSLPGVVGAVVALPDGLRVASQVPADLNADTLAAFLPQIFERVNQSTRELRMGTLNNVSFTVGNVPWKIFRVNSVYFAAFGRAGESLPTAQLLAMAAQIDRKKNQ